MASRGIILLPPSKGKAPGGSGPAYISTLASEHPLGPARRQLLKAVEAAAGSGDTAIARIAGVRSADVGAARERLATLASAATMPASQRYTGIVHSNAGLPAMDPATLAEHVLIVSPLAGLVGADEPVPDYRLEFSASLPDLGGLATFWRHAAHDYLADRIADATVWDLLPGEHARIWPSDRSSITDVAHCLVTFRFLTPTGRAANAARTKVAKGNIVARLLADSAITPHALVETVNLDGGWQIAINDDDDLGGASTHNKKRTSIESPTGAKRQTPPKRHSSIEIVATWVD